MYSDIQEVCFHHVYDVYFELYSPVPLLLDAPMDDLILTTLSYGKMAENAIMPFIW